MNYDTFLRFIFPDSMFDYFEMTQFNELTEKVEIYFEDKNSPPEEYKNDKLESKGFYEEVRMYDYPMRGRSCILYIKKHRWYNHTKEKYISRNWTLKAMGVRSLGVIQSSVAAYSGLYPFRHFGHIRSLWINDF